jgi:hypothetical protein
MAKSSKRTFATAWVNSFKETGYGPELETTNDVVNGFGRLMKKGGHQWAIEKKQKEVAPADWIDREPLVPFKNYASWDKAYLHRGNDSNKDSGVDTVDMALISSHGGNLSKSRDFGGVVFTIGLNVHPGQVGNFQMRLGNTKLKWLIIDACHSLETENDPGGFNPSNLWRHTFDGLHAIFGFTGQSTDHWWTSDRGSRFALKVLLWDQELADAWIDAASFAFLRDLPGAVAVGVSKEDAESRLATERLSSSFDGIDHSEIKYFAWRFRFTWDDARDDKGKRMFPEHSLPGRIRGGAP